MLKKLGSLGRTQDSGNFSTQIFQVINFLSKLHVVILENQNLQKPEKLNQNIRYK
jgi:hypothetical protein